LKISINAKGCVTDMLRYPKLRQRVFAAAVASATLCALGTSAFAAAQKQKLDELTVALNLSALGAQPVVLLAENNGYFEEEGLKVNFAPLQTGVMEALSIGKVDAYMNGITPPLTYGNKKANVKIYAGTASGGVFAIAKAGREDELKDPKNWRGLTLVTTTLSTSEHIIRIGLAERGIDFKEVRHVEVDTDNNIIEAIRKGTADVGFLLPEYGVRVRDLGVAILFPNTDLVHDYVCCRQSGNSKAIEENRPAYVKFLQAQIRAYKDYVNDEEKTVKLLSKFTNQTEDYVRAIVYDPVRSAERKYNPDPNLKGTLAFYTSLIDSGYLDGRVRLTEFFDTSIYEEALGNIIARYPDDEFYKDMRKVFEESNLNVSGKYL
jgi:NitT/TauT family transport system substrate-binding protein